MPALDAMSEEMVRCEDVDPTTYEQYRRVITASGVEIAIDSNTSFVARG
jgi:hypothetical protein